MLDRRILVPLDMRAGPPLIRRVAAQGDKPAPLKLSARLHPSALALRQNVFAEALLEKTSARERRRPGDWIISLAIHLAVVAALLVVPLFFTQAIDLKQFTTTILVAPSAPPPPPPAVVALPTGSHRPLKSSFQAGRLIAPTVVPRAIPQASQDVPSPDVNLDSVAGGLSGGIPGGVPGGLLGGVLGGTGLPASPAAPVVNVRKGPVRISGNVKRPRLVYSIQPDYPVLARQAQVQGTVAIDAVIDEQGNVVELHAISGSPLLIPAALQAVAKWKYEPTYLNGVAVSIELTVEVTFQFR